MTEVYTGTVPLGKGVPLAIIASPLAVCDDAQPSHPKVSSLDQCVDCGDKDDKWREQVGKP